MCIAHYLKKYWHFHRYKRLSSVDAGYPLRRIVLTTLILIISYLRYGVVFYIEHLPASAFPYAQKVVMIFALTMIFMLTFNRAVRNSCYLTRCRIKRAMIRHVIHRFVNKFSNQLFFNK